VTDIDDLLARTRLLLNKKPPKPPVEKSVPRESVIYRIAFRATRCYQFLTNKTSDEVNKSHLIHVYSEPDTDETPIITIIHNHPRHLSCSAPLFCYELGYSPTGAENPTFIQLFKESREKA
jgi:hypothetical protein